MLYDTQAAFKACASNLIVIKSPMSKFYGDAVGSSTFLNDK